MSNPFSYSIASIIAEICERVGMPFDAFDVGMIDGFVDGFTGDIRTDAYAIINELSGVYQFDASNYDGTVHFVPRGLPSIGVVDSEVDVVDLGESTIRTKRRDGVNVPRVMNLNYYDITGGLGTDKQQSDRSLDDRGKNETSVNTTVIMDADTAKSSVVIAHKLSMEEKRGTLDFTLPFSWLWLTVGDCLIFDNERIRIIEVRIGSDSLRCRASYDRKSVYQNTIPGIPPAEESEPPPLVVADTRIEFIDSHIIKSADDTLGYYMAVTGLGLNWKGAQIELSRDGGENYIASRQVVQNDIIGEVIGPIGDHVAEIPDEINTLGVRLIRDDMVLIPATFTEVLNRQNLAIVGDELINFQGVNQVTDTDWELTSLLRGRKGTETVEHLAGERFVVMSADSSIFVPAELFDLDRELTFRVTSIGGDTSETVTVLFTGESQQERQPAYLYATNNGGTLEVSWQGVGRLGGGASVGMGAYFKQYVITLDGNTYTTTDTSIDIPYTAGTVEVAQENTITGIGPSISLVV